MTDLISSWYRGVLLSLEAQGLEVAPLVAEVNAQPTPTGKLRSAWDALVGVLELALARHGSACVQGAMHDFATRHSTMRLSTELLCSPRLTYLVLLEAMAAGQAMVQVAYKSSATGLSLRFELHRSLPPSRGFLQCLSWLLVAVPRARGLPDAKLLSERLGDRDLELALVPPPPPSFAITYPETAARTLARDLFRLPASAISPPRESPTAPTTQTLQSRFGLTRAEARVVKLLAEGRSMKRIAEELGVSLETTRTHAKRAMQKTDTHRQAELVSLVLQGQRRRED
ncbi:MAG TPA: helix-turn-helix transcriptional regulator [Archangium sp.]